MNATAIAYIKKYFRAFVPLWIKIKLLVRLLAIIYSDRKTSINAVRTYGKNSDTAVKATILESANVISNRFLDVTIKERRLTVELSIQSTPLYVTFTVLN